MMKIPIYQVDAFAGKQFAGNPAAVCLLKKWLPDELLHNIAAENNLSETAFLVEENNGWHIRWFTPRVEVNLCGHATLASAFTLFEQIGHDGDTISFHSKSGLLTVARRDDLLVLDFPAIISRPVEAPPGLIDGMGKAPQSVFVAEDYMLIYESEQDILALRPRSAILAQVECRGVIATAAGKDVDFVSRFFAPGCGIDEDPVTGSAHCMLTPYWAERLGQSKMEARQLSPRGGELGCELVEERVLITGRASLFMKGEITLL